MNTTFLNHCKEAYYFELERKDRINSNVNIHITIITIVIGAIAFFLNNLPDPQINIILIMIFYLSLLLSSVFTLIVFYIIFKTITGYKYEFIASTETFENYINDVNAYNKQVSKNEKIDINTKFENLLFKQFCKCATRNQINNDKKSGYLNSLSRKLSITVILIFFTSIPFFILNFTPENKIQNIRIINFEDSEMLDKKDETPINKNTNDSDKTNNQKPEPPKEPTTRTVLESEHGQDKDSNNLSSTEK